MPIENRGVWRVQCVCTHYDVYSTLRTVGKSALEKFRLFSLLTLRAKSPNNVYDLGECV